MISCKEYTILEKQRIAELPIKNIKFDIFQVGDNPASNAYIRGKMKDCAEASIKAELHKFDESITHDELAREVAKASEDSAGIIIQLPVPSHINAFKIIREHTKPYQDVDGFVFDVNEPCTPLGIINWLEFNNVEIEGKNVVIIGRSRIVGRPLAKMMEKRNATVTLCHSKTSDESMKKFCQLADIIVVAVGRPKFFSFDVTDKKPIIVDVGINRVENKKLVGDVDKEYMEKQGCYVTPVPGGVGLLTRLALIQNIIKNIEK